MTDYQAILQYVTGNIYELKGLDSGFHIHQPKSDLIAFYAPERYNKEIFVQLVSGEKMIFEQVTEELMAAVEPVNAAFDSIYQQFLNGKQPKRQTNAELVRVDLKQLVDVFCKMQYHIMVTNGLWATDEPDAFKDHPSHALLWQVWFGMNNGKATSYEDRR